MKGVLMSKPEPSIDLWLKEAKSDPKAEQCGMFLTHNGVVRITPKQLVREGISGLGDVRAVEFSYDKAGVDAAVLEALSWPGVYYVRVWLNEGVLSVGDSIMYVLIGADIRPNCIDALQKLVGKIKTDLVVEKEIYG
jgi:molybdopterin synthase catalytic subunit